MTLKLDQKLRLEQINGIQNNSSWCFVNSAIQILYSIDLIRNYILNLDLDELKEKKYYTTYQSLKYIFILFNNTEDYLSDDNILDQKKIIVKDFALNRGAKSQNEYHQGTDSICYADGLYFLNTLLCRLSDIDFFKEKFKIGRLEYIQFLNGNNIFLDYYQTVNFKYIKEKLNRDIVPTFRANILNNIINENNKYDAIQKMKEKKENIEQFLGEDRGKVSLKLFDLAHDDNINIEEFNKKNIFLYSTQQREEYNNIKTVSYKIDYNYSNIFYDNNKNIEFVFLDRNYISQNNRYLKFEEEQIFFNKKYKLKSILLNTPNSHFWIKVKIDNEWYELNDERCFKTNINHLDYQLWQLCVYEIDKTKIYNELLINLLINNNYNFLNQISLLK